MPVYKRAVVPAALALSIASFTSVAAHAASTGLTVSLTTTAVLGLEVNPDFNAVTDSTLTSQVIDYGDGTVDTDPSSDTVPVEHAYANPGTYTLTYTATDAAGDTASATSTFTTTGSEYQPISAVRLLDTRKDLGGTSAQLADDGSIKLKVAGVDGIPADVTSVDLNLTAINADGGGFIEANTGTSNGTSNLNYGPSFVYSNSVIAQVASDGTVTLQNTGATKSVETDLIADATGYFAKSQGDRFDFATTSRLMDTRTGQGGSKGALIPGDTDVLTVDGAGNLPASGITAAAVNLTVTDTTHEGYLVMYADGTPVPGTSDVDWQGNTNKATNVIVPVGSDGKIDISNPEGDTGSTDVVVDVTGYFTDSPNSGDVYVPITSSRVLDTRKTTPITASTSRTVNLTNAPGIPAPTGQNVEQPTAIGVDGFVLNATVTDTEQQGWLLLSDSQSQATTSTVNWTGADQTVANLSITQNDYESNDGLSYSYSDWAYNGSPTKPVQAIVDVMGYFVAG